ncbi:lamin tail domain-containing protein [Myceligenerans crystallogenes]|uniref:LTD domain-containing protein n=1 Tax=Myceligenerans crystallogenes TaxID=316335 RepID=A0ABN2NDA5_9MICO
MKIEHARRPLAVALLAVLLTALMLMAFMVRPASAETNTGATTASITSGVKITKVLYNPDGNELYAPNGEKVSIKNVSRRTKNLQGVVLSDDDGHAYRLPYYNLSAGSTVVVRSGSGERRYGVLYAGWNTAVWNNTGDVARLKASSGTLIDRCTWGSSSGTTAYC